MIKQIFLLVIIFYVFFIISPIASFAQKYNFRNYTTQDGLANNLVIDLLQDKSGRVWISTGDGVSCYDGTKFKNYTTDDGLINNRVYTVYQQFEHLFWIGTETGITKLEIKNGQEIFTPLTEKEAPKIGAVASILEKDGKVLFIGKTGIIKFDGQNFSLFPNLPSNSQMRFRCGYKDSRGNLWIGSNQGLIKLDITSYEYRIYGSQYGILSSDNLIRGIYQDSVGDFWLSFQESGIIRVCFQNQTITKTQIFTQKDGLPSDLCFKIIQDKAGNYWVTTYNGLVKFSLEKSNNPNQTDKLQILQIYQEQNGLVHSSISSILLDRENNLWFGTHHGLSKLTNEKFVSYDVGTGLLSNTIYKTVQDSDGDIWVATHKGVNLLTNNKTLALSTIDPILDNDTNSLFIDSKGKIWVIQEQQGVFAFEKKQKDGKLLLKRVVSLESKDGVNRPINLVEDRLGQIWIATYTTELVCYNGNAIKIYNSSTTDNFPETRLLSINNDSNGDIWVGAHEGAIKGIIKADGSPSFKYYFSKEGLEAKRIKNIYQDSRGNIWFSSDNSGLFSWDGKTFIRYTTLDGLSSNTTYGVLEYPKDTFWIATSKGVDRFVSGKFKNYNYNDGTTQKSSDVKWVMIDKDKNFWFATEFGLRKYLPSLDYEVTTPPTIEIESIRLDQQPLQYAKYSQLLENKPVLFPYFENSFEFDFLGISFINEDLIYYQYQLEGFDKNWSTTKERTVRYNNLIPGKYLFKIKALNKNSLASEVKTLQIEIQKPFWLQLWFLLLSPFTIAASIYVFYAYRIRKIEIQKQHLELLVKERTNEVIFQKNELEEKNEELKKKNEELIQSKEELIQSNQKIEVIFSALSDLLPGTTLDDKYRLEDKIGSGGFGIVFRATHLNLNRDVAIKVFRPTDNNVTVEALQRFQREGVSACRVNHPNAISILDSGITSTGIPYLVMELLKGHTLKAELRKKNTLSLKRCAQILLPICNALSKAHLAGIIHRDIKPDNIFLHNSPTGEIVKVVDFGIAKLLGDGASNRNESLTEAGSIVGTPTYMAPERLSNKPYDGKADVYSLGIMLYEIFTGDPPFQVNKEDFWSIISLHLTELPPSITKQNSSIPQEVEDIVFQALSKNPINRPTTKELAEKFASAIGLKYQVDASGGLQIEEIEMIVNNDETMDTTTRVLKTETPKKIFLNHNPKNKTNSFENKNTLHFPE
ncbi:MAG: protein kinase domain-containing protein [bacterium]|nr:MAG: protein kinase domain-containing protein [bacterium]